MPTPSEPLLGASRWTLPLSDVRLPPEAVNAASEVLESGWLSSGPRVLAFEEELADYTGAAYAVACSSGTAALQLALASLGVASGDEIVMPSLTFVACANVARLAGATPVFADVLGDDDLTLAPESVDRAIGPRTRALVLMHYGGYPCAPELVDMARERGVAVIEDAAHAIGASAAPGHCGTWGEAGCYSFFANKNLPLGEGGMLLTDDAGTAETARRLRSHGMTATTWERHAGGAEGYDVTAVGFNVRLDEVRAAIGSVLLPGLEEANARRARAVELYRSRLSGAAGVRMPFSERPAGERPAHHLAVALLDDPTRRTRVAAELARRGIQTSVHYPPIHTLSAYAGSGGRLERTEALAPRLLTLPLYPHIEEGQVHAVCDALEEALANHP